MVMNHRRCLGSRVLCLDMIIVIIMMMTLVMRVLIKLMVEYSDYTYCLCQCFWEYCNAWTLSWGVYPNVNADIDVSADSRAPRRNVRGSPKWSAYHLWRGWWVAGWVETWKCRTWICTKSQKHHIQRSMYYQSSLKHENMRCFITSSYNFYHLLLRKYKMQKIKVPPSLWSEGWLDWL